MDGVRPSSRPSRLLPLRIFFFVPIALVLGWPAGSGLGAQEESRDPHAVVLRPGDLVRIEVWRQPELSGEFYISENGYIAHPLYRSIYAVNRPLGQVEESLRLFLSEFETEPNFVMEVFFQVAVGGQVRQPNVHALRPGTTIAEAVARAGGVTEEGRLDRVILRRGGMEYRVDLTDPAGAFRQTTVRSGDEIVVERRRSRFRDYVIPTIGVLGSIASIWRLVEFYR